MRNTASASSQNVSWRSSELTWPAKLGSTRIYTRISHTSVTVCTSYRAPKNAPHTGCVLAPTANRQPKPFQPTSRPIDATLQAPKCSVTKQCGVTKCVAKMWRHRQMRRHQKNVAPNNAAPKCGVTGKCGVARKCGCGVTRKCGVTTKMWRHLSPKCVFEMRLQRQVEKWMRFCPHRVFFEIFFEILPCHFSWQAQYLVRLDGDTCCSAHCK